MSNILTPLIPIIVMCCQQPLVVVRLPDGRLGVTLQSLCEALNLNRPGQLQRIRRNWALAEHLVLVPLVTKSGLQHMDVLMAEAISKWLVGIQIDRLAPEKRPIARALQKDAEREIAQHFSTIDTEQTAQPTAQQPPEPEVASRKWVEAEPLPSVPDTIWERLYEVMAGFERKWQAVEQDIAGLKTELAEIRQRLRGASAAGQSQRDKRPLSLEHIMQLHTLARSLESRSGEPVSALFRQLAEVFDVTDVSAIPDAGWEHILTWFWQHAQQE